MQILLDTANMDAIETAIEFYPIDGFTTNPSILAGVGAEAKDVVKAFHAIVKPEQTMHMQTTAVKAEDMVMQGKALSAYFGPNFHLKIPMTKEGMKAVCLAKEAGIKTTVTAIFTSAQALLAAKAGADYVAPYVNRIDNISGDGIRVVSDIIQTLKNYGYKTKVLAASFKNVQQISELARAGCHAVTIVPELIDVFVNHPYTVKSLDDFERAWEASFPNQHVTDLIEKGE